MKGLGFVVKAGVLCGLVGAIPARAGTLAYWNFENGAAGTDVPHAAADGVFAGSTPDLSGNGNTLSTWTQGSYAGFAYRADHPVTRNPNTLSIKNTGGYPAAMSMDENGNAGLANSVLNTATFARFTVEASWKPEAGGYRTIVGRDARYVANVDGSGDGNLASLYLQARPDDSVGILYTDVQGKTHEVFSAAGFIKGFSFGSDPEGATGTWYNLAAVSDGTLLKLYVDNVLLATTDMTTGAEASTDAALAVGTGGGAGWKAGTWTVGRGLYNGGHGDRAYGFIDEVRISDSALSADQLLSAVSAVPEPSLVGGLAGAILLLRRTRRNA